MLAIFPRTNLSSRAAIATLLLLFCAGFACAGGDIASELVYQPKLDGHPAWDNKYSYTNGDPVNYYDPMGLDRVYIENGTVWWGYEDEATGGEIGRYKLGSYLGNNIVQMDRPDLFPEIEYASFDKLYAISRDQFFANDKGSTISYIRQLANGVYRPEQSYLHNATDSFLADPQADPQAGAAAGIFVGAGEFFGGYGMSLYNIIGDGVYRTFGADAFQQQSINAQAIYTGINELIDDPDYAVRNGINNFAANMRNNLEAGDAYNAMRPVGRLIPGVAVAYNGLSSGYAAASNVSLPGITLGSGGVLAFEASVVTTAEISAIALPALGGPAIGGLGVSMSNGNASSGSFGGRVTETYGPIGPGHTVGKRGGVLPEILNRPIVFNRGNRKFSLNQGSANPGWKHIFDRHIDLNRFSRKSKFSANITQDDLLMLLNRTLKHGAESVYEGLSVFTKRIRLKGQTFEYRATINADGTIRTFHPLD